MGPAVDSHQNPNCDQTEYQACSAEADKWQRQSVVGQHRRGHGDVLDGRNDNDTSQTERDAAVKHVVRLEGDAAPCDGDQDITEDHPEREGQSQFFSHHRENEVDVGKGQGPEFFHSIAKPNTPGPAVAELAPERLLALRQSTTIESIGSSTRIEG